MAVKKAVKNILLITILVVSMMPIALINANAVGVECNGHTIERISNKEVNVNGTKYKNGYKITLVGKTYTVKIGSGNITGTDKNDFIVGSNDDDTLAGGDDIICGGDGDDILFGDYIYGENGDDKLLEGGKDVLKGGDDKDDLYGDWIFGGDDNDKLFGGNDKLLEGGKGADRLYGDWLEGEGDNDNASGGNDIIDTIDGKADFDINGDVVRAENANVGTKDSCYYDKIEKGTVEHCELKGELVAISPINIGESTIIAFSSSVDKDIAITNITVEDPNGNLCNYDGTLPITIPATSDIEFIYPDQFGICNTNTAGMYTATLYTEIGDPITIVFYTSFHVLPESIIGAIGVIGASIAVFTIYTRRK